LCATSLCSMSTFASTRVATTETLLCTLGAPAGASLSSSSSSSSSSEQRVSRVTPQQTAVRARRKTHLPHRRPRPAHHFHPVRPVRLARRWRARHRPRRHCRRRPRQQPRSRQRIKQAGPTATKKSIFSWQISDLTHHRELLAAAFRALVCNERRQRHKGGARGAAVVRKPVVAWGVGEDVCAAFYASPPPVAHAPTQG